MQTTLARKQAALQTLDSKSKALKKNIEPRNAYKLTNRSDMQSENGAQFDPNSSRISIWKLLIELSIFCKNRFFKF